MIWLSQVANATIGQHSLACHKYYYPLCTNQLVIPRYKVINWLSKSYDPLINLSLNDLVTLNPSITNPGGNEGFPLRE